MYYIKRVGYFISLPIDKEKGIRKVYKEMCIFFKCLCIFSLSIWSIRVYINTCLPSIGNVMRYILLYIYIPILYLLHSPIDRIIIVRYNVYV